MSLVLALTLLAQVGPYSPPMVGGE